MLVGDHISKILDQRTTQQFPHSHAMLIETWGAELTSHCQTPPSSLLLLSCSMAKLQNGAALPFCFDCFCCASNVLCIAIEWHWFFQSRRNASAGFNALCEVGSLVDTGPALLSTGWMVLASSVLCTFPLQYCAYLSSALYSIPLKMPSVSLTTLH